MIVVNRSALVGHAAQEMYALVAGVEYYPQFLRWCDRVVVSVNEPSRTVATLWINFHGLKQQFTTENLNQPGTRIDIKLVRGPFRSLEGSWLFTRLSENACKVELSLRYQFASTLLEKAIGPVFRHIAESFVDAFKCRADEQYGKT